MVVAGLRATTRQPQVIQFKNASEVHDIAFTNHIPLVGFGEIFVILLWETLTKMFRCLWPVNHLDFGPPLLQLIWIGRCTRHLTSSTRATGS